MSTEKCSACGYLNNTGRLFCQQCGEKLSDPTPAVLSLGLPLPPPLRESPEREPLFSGSLLGGVLKCVVRAAVVAALVTALMPPQNLPPWEPANPGGGTTNSHIEATLLALSNSPLSMSCTFNNQQVNTLLQRAKLTLSPGCLVHRRTCADLQPGQNRLILEIALFGYPLYYTFQGTLDASPAEGLAGTCQSGSIGRLPLPGVVTRLLAKRFAASLPATLPNEHGLLQKFDKVELVDQGLKVSWRAPVLAKAAPSATPHPTDGNSAGFSKVPWSTPIATPVKPKDPWAHATPKGSNNPWGYATPRSNPKKSF